MLYNTTQLQLLLVVFDFNGFTSNGMGGGVPAVGAAAAITAYTGVMQIGPCSV